MLFIPAISSTLSRTASSNVHLKTEFIFLPIAPRGLSERDHLKIALSRFETTVQSQFCCKWKYLVPILYV